MQQVYDAMSAYLKGKKVAFIGAGVSHKQCIEQLSAIMPIPFAGWAFR